MEQTNTGTVKWYDESKGFGFIIQEDGPDIVVHASNIKDEFHLLNEGERGSFDIRKTDIGLSAENVVCI